ncbi:hypothetical protein ABFS82_11G077600 [Erythranthe guttata]|uniref:WW domain-containing protein n=1 Tax=Erythranthe guttata TaxID=4155 RepID=A0A022REP6_ERYGU|nr:PREDICTED: uncharacterized protein LOC105958059 [Erythranthe guttata]EYU37365.1 hypothetical protein MIMGU_mgv1a013897mg [Erythranthe guttata]|eukprot:XP_012837517.1 PREDICTED: uncharacterized protein LOC105958059 [Erythranthe guttata]
MATPNMATITASLERSLQNCSLNHQQSSSTTTTTSGGGGAAAHGSDSPPIPAAEEAALELNSEGSLPFHWEQCLDLKTGEIYYINWRTGMKAKEDPRNTAVEYGGGGGGEYYSEDDNSSYDSEGSSSESCPSSSREQWSYQENYNCQEDNENEDKNNNDNNNNSGNVLVVAGCKSCLMYYMVPKQLDVCPKCCGQLLHFDRSENLSN